MGRILAIDYGTKRVGLAVTDSLQLIASGLATVHAKDLIKYLQDYMAKEEVECIVVGHPKHRDNTDAELETQIKPFLVHLKRTFPDIRIEREDERFTSKLAFQSMIDAGLKKKDRGKKELIDLTSATIILQSYMERNK